MSIDNLTEREITTAKLISLGYTAKEIADYLGVRIGVVDYMVEKIKRKLECNKNTQIAYIMSKRL
jgi:DNA-binding CsgD family transcriptional regulator